MKTVATILPTFLLMATVGMVSNECLYEGEVKPDDEAYYIYNPNYPKMDTIRQTCKWIAHSTTGVKLTCREFHVTSGTDNCLENHLAIEESGSASRLYCGNEPFTYVSKMPTTTITLQLRNGGAHFLCSLVALNATLECKCGWKNPTKIVGGEETGVNEYPMMAGLVDVSKLPDTIYCGATIIHQIYLLTAAHCVLNRNVNDMWVVVADTDYNATMPYKVKRVIVHPSYETDSHKHDIAVVELVGKIAFSMEVGPVCLPFEHHCDSFAGFPVEALGWGLTEFAGEQSPTLQRTKRNAYHVYPLSKCIKEVKAPDTAICTIGRETDTCQMDSGGPILIRNPTTASNMLIGVIGAGIGCAAGYPAINTKVGLYVAWIISVTPGATYCTQE